MAVGNLIGSWESTEKPHENVKKLLSSHFDRLFDRNLGEFEYSRFHSSFLFLSADIFHSLSIIQNKKQNFQIYRHASPERSCSYHWTVFFGIIRPLPGEKRGERSLQSQMISNRGVKPFFSKFYPFPGCLAEH